MVLLPFKDPERGQADLRAGEPLRKPSLKDYASLFRNGQYQLLIWGYVAYTFAMGAFAFWGPTFLETIHHMPTQRADRFFSGVLVLGGLIGTLGGGFAATAWQKRNPAGYAWLLGTATLLAAPAAFMGLLAHKVELAMLWLAITMFLLFLSTGPINTLILELVPVNLRASAMALSIFMIHLFGDMWSPEIVGRLAERWGNDLRKGVLVLPAMVFCGALLWVGLALRMQLRARARREPAS
jgi:MFS family permease